MDSEYRSTLTVLCSYTAVAHQRALTLFQISDVHDFIMTLEGCERYAHDFEEQEVDGRALLLLNEDHLLNALDIKLGPALKIIDQINSFRYLTIYPRQRFCLTVGYQLSSCSFMRELIY